jgi:hypothetical protein
MARIVCNTKIPLWGIIAIFIFSLFTIFNIIALAIPPYSDIHLSFWICPSINIEFFVSLIILLLLHSKWDDGDSWMVIIFGVMTLIGALISLFSYIMAPIILFESEVDGMSVGSKFKYFFDKYNFKFINLMFYPFLAALFCAIGILAIILWIFYSLYDEIDCCCHIEKNKDTDVERGESVTSQNTSVTSQPKDIESPEYDNTSPPEYTV